MKKFLLPLLCTLVFLQFSWAQMTLPPGGGNQKSVTTQYIGSLVHVTVTYNSPDVTSPQGEDRTGKIWGQLVPYGMNNLGFGTAKESPWRAGANENTTISFSHDVEVQGKAIAAGTYGFHVIAQEEGDWTIIFNKNTTAWGSYFYKPTDDVLRVNATPEESEFNEWLTFEFVDRQATEATLALKWEKLALPFTISVPNMNDIYAAKMKADLDGALGFNFQNWNAAANWSLQNDYNLEQGLEWAEKAVSAPFIGVENFNTLQTKAGILEKMGKKDEAMTTLDKAVEHGATTAFQIHGYGRQLIAQGNKEKALKIFKYNHERFGGAWPTEVGMARGYSAVGKYDMALKHCKIALEQAPDQLNKDNLTSAVERLKNKEDIN